MALVVPDTVVLLFHVREGSGLHSEFGLLGLGPEFSLCFAWTCSVSQLCFFKDPSHHCCGWSRTELSHETSSGTGGFYLEVHG